MLLNLPSGGNWGGSWGCNTGGRASVDGDSAPIEYEISHLKFCIFECVLGDGWRVLRHINVPKEAKLTGQQRRRPWRQQRQRLRIAFWLLGLGLGWVWWRGLDIIKYVWVSECKLILDGEKRRKGKESGVWKVRPYIIKLCTHTQPAAASSPHGCFQEKRCGNNKPPTMIRDLVNARWRIHLRKLKLSTSHPCKFSWVGCMSLEAAACQNCNRRQFRPVELNGCAGSRSWANLWTAQ